MKERVLLRFDTVIAICALLTSTVAAGAMVYQTRVIGDQFSATVWPYLSLEEDNDPHNLSLKIVNDGAGPALVRSAQLFVDGKVAESWSDFLIPVFTEGVPKHGGRRMIGTAQISSLGSAEAIRAGDSKSLIMLRSMPETVIAAVQRHRVALRVCYCSVNDRCWQLEESLSKYDPQTPQSVRGCATGGSINAEQFKVSSS
jgi:hypothetical protein